jgi:hypothetical protein
MSVVVAQTVDEFLNHRTQEKGGGYLKGWKKDGKLRHFLHTKHVPTAVWSHTFPTIVTFTDKDTNKEVRHVWSRNYGCPETEKLLKSQYFRFDDGSRKFPPRECGQCRLNEWFYQRLNEGALPIETPIFRVTGDLGDEATTIHLGGALNLLKPDKLSLATKERLQKAGVSLNWKATKAQNLLAGPNYVAVVVKADAPTDGALVTTIRASLGDKIKTVIANEMKKAIEVANHRKQDPAAARALRDPFTHPYMFEWTFNDQLDPKEMYGVIAYPDIPPSDAVRAVIEGDPVDLTREFEPMSQAKLRMKLERACLLDKRDQPPWDTFFPPAEDDSDEVGAPADEDAVEFPPKDVAAAPAGPAPQQRRAPEVSTQASTRPKTPEEICAGIPASELYECTECRKGSPTADKCVWCGIEYDEQGNVKPRAEAPKEEPKAMRSRATRGSFKAKF